MKVKYTYINSIFPSPATMATFVLYDGSYGGFTLSDEALELLGWPHDARYLVLETDVRSNRELVRVCKKLGARASEDGKSFKFVDVASSDVPFVTLSEYDGAESLTIDHNAKARAEQASLIQMARHVLACNMSAAEKVAVLTTLLK